LKGEIAQTYLARLNAEFFSHLFIGKKNSYYPRQAAYALESRHGERQQ